MPFSGISLSLFGIPSIDVGGDPHPLTSSAARLSTYLALGPRSGRLRSLAAAQALPRLASPTGPAAAQHGRLAAEQRDPGVVRQRPDRHPAGRADHRHRRGGAGQRRRLGVHRPRQRRGPAAPGRGHAR
ncbi:hypothetical protein G5V59_25075 [Nocardioides sp. W3-2-3]|uniref:hypothetical protein n=1 Tax=Nocardioides convexus TaxID=2712224 RepID=UPI00241819C8|nr:hypothetical protein [Nocardioides convexus]NHA01831.1 hypothetical protein [Nocardioides convexus]